MAGNLTSALAAFNVQANCHCLITKEHSLHSYRTALDGFDTDRKAIDLLQSLPQCSSNLLCTHIVETRTGIRKLRGLPFVQSVQIDEYCSVAEYQHDGTAILSNTNPEPLAYLQYVIELVQYDKAWEYTQGEGVKVAVLDTGIFPHGDLAANLIDGKNFTAEQDTNDLNGHGTHVAGSIACAINNKGIFGAAPKVSIAAVKVMGKGGGGFSSDISRGVIWAADNGFDVLNLSLGPFSLTYSKDAFDYAYSKGALTVMASGNSGSTLPSTWGAAYEKNISVGNSNQADLRHSSSMYGPLVDVAAPGTKIISCGLNSSTYTTKTGTSMASPHVAALVALMVAIAKANNYKLSLEETRDLLKKYGKKIHTDRPIGNRINAINTVEGLIAFLENGEPNPDPGPDPDPNPDPDPDPQPDPEPEQPDPEDPEPDSPTVVLHKSKAHISYNRQNQALLNYVDGNIQFSRNYQDFQSAWEQLQAIKSSSYQVTFNTQTGVIKTIAL